MYLCGMRRSAAVWEKTAMITTKVMVMAMVMVMVMDVIGGWWMVDGEFCWRGSWAHEHHHDFYVKNRELKLNCEP